MSLLQHKLKYYSQIYKSELDVIHQIICVLGNGVSLDNKGYIYAREDIQITEPVKPLKNVYPFTRKDYVLELAGCRNKGFKEAVQYLIDCILITPDQLRDIKQWKDNISVLEELRDAPLFVDHYESKEQGLEYFNKELESCTTTTETGSNKDSVRSSVRNVKFFDVQWSDCPTFVLEDIKQIWSDFHLGNDDYIYKTALDDDLFERYPRVYFWLLHKDVKINEQVIIHWWW